MCFFPNENRRIEHPLTYEYVCTYEDLPSIKFYVFILLFSAISKFCFILGKIHNTHRNIKQDQGSIWTARHWITWTGTLNVCSEWYLMFAVWATIDLADTGTRPTPTPLYLLVW